MSSNKPITAIIERLIERRKAGETQPAKRKPKPSKGALRLKPLDASIPAKRTLH